MNVVVHLLGFVLWLSICWPLDWQMWTLYFCPVVSSSIFFFFLAYSQRSWSGCLPYFYTWCGLSANLECRSEMWCTRLAGNTGHKNDEYRWRPLFNAAKFG